MDGPVAVFAGRGGLRRGRWRPWTGAGAAAPGTAVPAAVQSLYGTRMGMSASRMDQVKAVPFSATLCSTACGQGRRPAGFEAPEIGRSSTIYWKMCPGGKEPGRLGGGAAARSCGSWSGNIRTTATPGTRSTAIGRKSARFRYLFSRLRTAAWPSWRTWRGSWPSRTFFTGGL